MWNEYTEKKIDLLTFNKKYYNRLLEYKSDVYNLGDDVWNDLSKLLEKMKNNNEEKEIVNIYDNIYDWADKNDILIKTK